MSEPTSANLVKYIIKLKKFLCGTMAQINSEVGIFIQRKVHIWWRDWIVVNDSQCIFTCTVQKLHFFTLFAAIALWNVGNEFPLSYVVDWFVKSEFLVLIMANVGNSIDQFMLFKCQNQK